MKQAGSILIILLFICLFLVVLLLGYIIGNKGYFIRKPSLSTTQVKTSKQPFNQNCTYNILPRDTYLNSYIVQRGDNLLVLAKLFLGSASRVNEIITLNEQQHRNLLNNLEVGWKIYFPPKFAFPSSGNIWGYSGEILDETDFYWEFRTVNIESAQLDYKLYKDPKTRYFGKSVFHTNDCVRVIIDGADQKTIAISSQDTGLNYFNETQ